MNFWPRWIKRINIGYTIAFVLLILGFVLTTLLSISFTTQSSRISGTDTTLNRLDELLTSLKSAQASWGEYSLTKSYKSLNQYYSKRKKIDSLFRKINQFSFIPLEQKNSLDTLGALLHTMFSQSSKDPVLQYQKSAARLLDSLKQSSIRNSMFVDSITAIIHSMEEKAQNGVIAKRRSLDSLATLLKIVGYCMLAVALFLAVYMFVIYNKEYLAKKKARKEANEYHNQLEARVEELTRMNKEIIRLKSMEKFTTLGRVATTIAHDIKNPLTNINLATDQLNDEIQNEDAKLYLTIIKRNSGKINEKISHFLNVTAFTALNTRNISVNHLMDEILTEAVDRIKLEGIVVDKNYDQDICDIKVDIEKIKTALSNLIINAIDAMKPDEEGVLKIHTLSKEDKCVIIIEDNGSGMSKETSAHIFEPYYTTKHGKGSGLGLAQSQNIILNHNGNIEVESKLGKGTRFTITLDFA